MPDNSFIPPEKPRNPITQEAHRRQSFWQIYFPLILTGILILVAIVATLFLDGTRASKWADISLLYMVSLAMIAFLIISIFLVVIVIYTAKLLKATPYYFFVFQKYAYLMEQRAKNASNVAVEPFYRIHSFFAGFRALRRK
jgi:hypothetical protein